MIRVPILNLDVYINLGIYLNSFHFFLLPSHKVNKIRLNDSIFWKSNYMGNVYHEKFPAHGSLNQSPETNIDRNNVNSETETQVA